MSIKLRYSLKLISKDSTIHGIRYITNSRSNQLTRVFWTIAFVISIIGMAFYIRGVYYKWRISPDIAITASLKPIREIPFPAITICSPVIVKNKYANFLKAYYHIVNEKHKHAFDDEIIGDTKMVSAVIQACDPNLSSIFADMFNESVSDELISYLIKGGFTKNESLSLCDLNNSIKEDCNKMFNQIFTDFGLCYSYNMQGYNTIFKNNTLDGDFNMFFRHETRNFLKENTRRYDDNLEEIEWTLQDGYSSKNDSVYPMRITSENGVEFVFRHDKNETNNFCPRLRNSYYVIFHKPNEIPTRFHDYVYLSMGSQLLVSMKANHFKADDGLKYYLPEKRRCYFANERKLKYFNSYTKAHCDLECLTNFTLKSCGCVKFSMPRKPDTPVCNLKDSICYHKAIRRWPNHDESFDDLPVPCGCFPPCNNILYNVKMIDHGNIESLFNLVAFDIITNRN